MSFFQLSDNTTAETTGTFEMGGGNIEPIPGNTQVKAIVDEAKWDDYNNERYISLRWSVIDGEYLNRKIFQKIRVCDADSAKKDKALRMLAAIDANAGGGLMKLGCEPTDMDLASNLTNKPQAILLQVWEMTKDNGEEISGNWVSMVAPVESQFASAQKPAQAAQNPAKQQGRPQTQIDEDVPDLDGDPGYDEDIGF